MTRITAMKDIRAIYRKYPRTVGATAALLVSGLGCSDVAPGSNEASQEDAAASGGNSASSESVGGTGGAADDGTGGSESVGGTGGATDDGTGGSESVGGTGGATDDGTGGSDDGSGGSSNDGDALSPGCDAAFSAPPPKDQQQTLEIGGDTRYYLMDVPENADNQTPLMLVFGLHGYDMNNIAVVDLFNFTERSGGQAITVWPQGEGPHPGDVSHWGDGVLESTWSANENNYAFLEQIMTDLGESYCIDKSRIFITGFSMGGFFTNQIACDHSDWFRAFAPVAGGGPNCGNSSVQSAIMLQHGTADDIVDPSSGEDSRDFWLSQNGCSASSGKSLNNCDFYEGCADESPVAWCTGNYEHYIPAETASNIWSFFSSF